MQSQTQQYTAHITQAADSKEERLERQELKAEELADSRSAKGGISAGLVGIGTGLWDGLSGTVLKPIKGAHEGGFRGFVKGVGDGAIGAVTKPTAGVIMASQEGLKKFRSIQTFERLRVPRAVFGDHILRTYDPFDARACWEMYTNEVRLRKEGKIAEASLLLEKRRGWVGHLEDVPSPPAFQHTEGISQTRSICKIWSLTTSLSRSKAQPMDELIAQQVMEKTPKRAEGAFKNISAHVTSCTPTEAADAAAIAADQFVRESDVNDIPRELPKIVLPGDSPNVILASTLPPPAQNERVQSPRMSARSERTPGAASPPSPAPEKSPRALFSSQLQNFRLRASGQEVALESSNSPVFQPISPVHPPTSPPASRPISNRRTHDSD